MAKNIDNIDPLGEGPNEKYRKFFDKFAEIDTLDVSQWKTIQLLAYFCKKYEEQYGVKYSFKFNSPSPSKCFEVFQINKLGMLLSKQPAILKDYIDWVYLNKVIKAKRRLTSISFMTNEGIVNEYKVNILLAGKNSINIDRSTPLPEKYQIIFKEYNITIRTYGDIAFLYKMDSMPDELILAFKRIEDMGFDLEILKRIV